MMMWQRSIAMLALLAAALMPSRTVVAAGCASVWEKIPNMPVAMGEVSAGVVKVNNRANICVVGQGNSAKDRGSTSTMCYDVKSRKWSSRGKRKCFGNHHCTVNVGGTMYLVGGLDGGCGKKFQSYNGRSWKSLPNLPFSTGSASCGYNGGRLWVCGGISSRSTTNKCASYSFKTKKWSLSGRQKRGTNHAGYCSNGSKLWMVGGRQGGNVVGAATNTCQIFDMKTKQGRSCSALKYPTAGLGNCIASKGNVWVFGGELNHDQFASYGGRFGGKKGGDGGVLKTVSILRRGSWLQRKRMPVGKHGIQPVQYGGYVYIIGGGTAAGNSKSKTGYRAKLTDLASCGP